MNDIDILARTIWGEARGEPPGGMEAVACVAMNRVRHPRWWGYNIPSVCFAPDQFDCWLPGDPNCDKCFAVTPNDLQFAQALDIAARAIAGHLPDPTSNADSYVDLRESQPEWARPDKFTRKIGNHSFYRLELAAP